MKAIRIMGEASDCDETLARHFSLMGTQERAQSFDCNVCVKSERGKATRVVAYVQKE